MGIRRLTVQMITLCPTNSSIDREIYAPSMRISFQWNPIPHRSWISLHSRSHSPKTSNNFPSAMEVEVKLRLPDSAAHQKLSDLLSSVHLKTHLQENIFFDGPTSQLASQLAALRLRFYDQDSLCVVSLKARPSILDGISRVSEDEEEMDPAIGRACVSEPWRLSSVDSRILKRVREEFGCGNVELVCLGGFRNVRAVYTWEGLKLELDETQYAFGTSYELECESADPDRAKQMLEDLLGRNGIPYKYSEVSKFAVFRSGKLPEF